MKRERVKGVVRWDPQVNWKSGPVHEPPDFSIFTFQDKKRISKKKIIKKNYPLSHISDQFLLLHHDEHTTLATRKTRTSTVLNLFLVACSTNFEIFVSIQLFASPSAACNLYRLVKEKAIILKILWAPFCFFLVSSRMNCIKVRSFCSWMCSETVELQL